MHLAEEDYSLLIAAHTPDAVVSSSSNKSSAARHDLFTESAFIALCFYRYTNVSTSTSVKTDFFQFSAFPLRKIENAHENRWMETERPFRRFLNSCGESKLEVRRRGGEQALAEFQIAFLFTFSTHCSMLSTVACFFVLTLQIEL